MIFGFIGKIIKLVLKTIYKFLSFFNLHITAFLVVVGAILFFTGVFANYPATLIIFYVLLIGSVVYSLLATVRKFLGLNKKTIKKQGVQIIEREDIPVNTSQTEQVTSQVQPSQVSDTPQESVSDKPIRYFAVKGNENVVVCEYEDKYVLYLKSQSGYKYIRTDYKG